LLETAKARDGKYTTYTLGFVVAPRINAAGRIKHAGSAFKLLTAQTKEEAQVYAQELDALNTQRQKLTERILSEAREQTLQQADRKVLLAAGEDWPKGVVGLVAGKLAEETGKPVLVMDKGPEFATGSARSFPFFDIVAGLKQAQHLLTKFGGHTQAAGFTLPTKNIELLYASLLKFADELPPPPVEVVLEADAELASNEYNWENYEWIDKFEPFGFGNLKPRFIGRGMQVVDSRIVGADGQHLKLRLLWNDKSIEAIAFRQGYWAPKLSEHGLIDVVFEMDVNEWNGHKDLQMKIIDIKQGE
jgi:single-stranded-DNA-specific exonuclease